MTVITVMNLVCITIIFLDLIDVHNLVLVKGCVLIDIRKNIPSVNLSIFHSDLEQLYLFASLLVAVNLLFTVYIFLLSPQL